MILKCSKCKTRIAKICIPCYEDLVTLLAARTHELTNKVKPPVKRKPRKKAKITYDE